MSDVARALQGSATPSMGLDERHRPEGHAAASPEEQEPDGAGLAA